MPGADEEVLIDIGQALAALRHKALARDGIERVEDRDVVHVEGAQLAVDHHAARLREIDHQVPAGEMEASAGIEPACKDLQSSA